MNVMGFRMRTGEDVIAEVLETPGESGWKLRKPTVPVPVPGPNGEPGQGGTQFMKWMTYAQDDEFTIYSDDMIGDPYTPWPQLENLYLEVTSGIAIAPASALVKP